ncbi:MAG: hypothetical protein HY897_07540 [Deltaproteobacteria bacterium]|nr:hypothetical protein [Deltaproteobacteria bacterium]
MKTGSIPLVLVAAALLLGACLGPDEPATELAISVHYSFAPAQGASDPDGGSDLQGQVGFAWSLDEYAAVVRVRVDGPDIGPQEQDLPVGYGTTDGSTPAQTEFYVLSGDGRTVSAIGYAAGGSGNVVAFETPAPVPVDMSGPEASVDLYPQSMKSGTVSGWVKRQGNDVTGGAVVIGDNELSVGFPSAPVARDPVSGQSRFALEGAPLNRALDVFYVDTNGSATFVGTLTLTGAQETFNVSL